MLYALTLTAALLGQTEEPATAPVETSPAVETAPESDAVTAAKAAAQAAAAAQRAAEAVEKLANTLLPAAPAAEAEAPAPSPWVGGLGVGLTYITGNADTLTLTGNASLTGTFGAWAIGIKASGAYGLANPDTNSNADAAVTARRASLAVRGDRSFGEYAAIFAQALGEFDHIKNIESRAVGEAGAALTFFNMKEPTYEKLYLRLDIAMRAGHETAYQYFPTPSPVFDENGNLLYGAAILAPRAALTFRWGFNDYVRFSEEFEVIPYVLSPYLGRVLINSTTKLNAKLTDNLSLATALVLNYDSTPPGGTRKPLDVALTVGLEATF